MVKPAGLTLYSLSRELVAVQIDLDEARRRDLVEHQPVGVDEEMMVGAGHAR
ncbi:hypothetical protein ACVWZL_001960 [Bradyrhizobium sp. GM2.4]